MRERENGRAVEGGGAIRRVGASWPQTASRRRRCSRLCVASMVETG